MVAANAPDVDVLSYVRGQYFALAFRRGITHGVPALLLWPFVIAGAMLAWDRFVRRRREPSAEPARFQPLLLLAAIGVLTHPALDWLNTYGMRWWLPFDPSWSYGDSLFIIDPWLWLMLGGAAALAGARSRGAAVGWGALATVTTLPIVLSGMVPVVARVVWAGGIAAVGAAWALGRPAGEAARVLTARALTAAAALYIAAMVVSHRAGVSETSFALSGWNMQVRERIMIAPLPARPFRSDVLIATQGGFFPGTLDWTADQRVTLHPERAVTWMTIADDVGEQEARTALIAARLDPDVANYLVWSRFPMWRVERSPGGLRVTVGDARYTQRTGGLSGLSVELHGRTGTGP